MGIRVLAGYPACISPGIECPMVRWLGAAIPESNKGYRSQDPSVTFALQWFVKNTAAAPQLCLIIWSVFWNED